MGKNKLESVLSTFWSFVKINLLCWGIYFASVILIVLILYHDVPVGQRDFTPINWINTIIFFIAYHNIFTIRIENEKIGITNEEFNIKQIVVDFFRKDRMQIIFMIIFSIIFETAMLLYPVPQNLVATIMVMFISAAGAIHIPVLRTVIGLTISLCLMLLSNILIKYKKYKYWNKE